MSDGNQESAPQPRLDPSRPVDDPAREASPVSPASPPDDAAPPAPPPAIPLDPIGPPLRRGEAGVFAWLLIVLAAGLASMLFGVPELGLLAALAGLAAVSHAIDLDRGWQLLRWITVPIVTAALVGVFAVVGYGISLQESGPARTVGLALSLAGAIASAVAALRPVARAVALWLFRADSHTMRLAARIVVGAALSCAPLWIMFRARGGAFAIEDQLTLGVGSLVASLLGMSLLALGAVGFLVRRPPGETFRRLGLEPLGPKSLGLVVAGLAALVLVNFGLEWVERRWFPLLWEEDQRFNDLLAGRLTGAGMVALALSAGVGEELTLRGALQPRLGLVRTALLFAALHVQYSWMGMLVIFALGLTLGWIRRAGSTSVAVAVHALYDLAALLMVDPTR